MKQAITIFILCAISMCSFAQTNMSFHYLHAIPLGEFTDNLTHNPSGISFEYLFQPFQDKKLQIGAALSVSMYQNEDHSGDVNISDFRRAYVETNEDDCLYTYQGIIRYYFTEGQKKFRPYLQEQVGGTTFFSTISFYEDTEDVFESNTRNHGTTWLLGTGGGLAIKIYEAMYIDLSASFNASGVTRYRTSPENLDGVAYRVDLQDLIESSKVNHIALKLGVNMIF